jgi:hypothetical protein
VLRDEELSVSLCVFVRRFSHWHQPGGRRRTDQRRAAVGGPLTGRSGQFSASQQVRVVVTWRGRVSRLDQAVVGVSSAASIVQSSAPVVLPLSTPACASPAITTLTAWLANTQAVAMRQRHARLRSQCSFKS